MTLRDLPPTRAGGALERTNGAGGNPASVEIAILRLHAFIVDSAFIDARSVKRQISGNVIKTMRWRGIAPCGLDGASSVDIQRPVDCMPLELAPRPPRRGLQKRHLRILRGKVIDGRMAGFEDAIACTVSAIVRRLNITRNRSMTFSTLGGRG